MPASKRPRLEPTDDWSQLGLRLRWPEQVAYELVRPVVLNGETAGERARHTGEHARAIARKADRFDKQGMLGLFPAPRSRPADPRSLPPPMRQLIVDLRAEVPGMSLREIAEICQVRYGRRPSHHSVQKVLASGPSPSVTTRRYPPYAQIPDPARRRLAIVRLHADGWRVTTIARYLETTRRRVYETLQRWVQEQFAGMPDRSHARKHPATKATLPVVNEIRKLQQNPELGEWRVHAALLQQGIHVSPSTCGRIMARNRALYGLDKPKRSPKPKREMPFKASKRHAYWSLDIRYIEKHGLDHDKPVYVISVLENYSRALMASTLSPTQDLVPVLMVLFEAFRAHGVPEAIVTDGGSVFRANRMVEVCRVLGIRRERIQQGQPWQNYIETHFSIMRRMADFHLEQAAGWEGMLVAHRRFVRDYNNQQHWAHRDREDGRMSPAEVLGWVRGVVYPEEALHRVLYATQYTRHIDDYGYVRLRNWRMYGERGLAGTPVSVWVYDGSIRLEYDAVLLSVYSFEWETDGKHIRDITNPKLVDTYFRSPQLALFELGPDEWLLCLRAPQYASRRHTRTEASVQLPLSAGLLGVG